MGADQSTTEPPTFHIPTRVNGESKAFGLENLTLSDQDEATQLRAQASRVARNLKLAEDAVKKTRLDLRAAAGSGDLEDLQQLLLQQEAVVDQWEVQAAIVISAALTKGIVL